MNSLSHVAIIMDGNGRWAKSRNKSRKYGHYKGSENIHQIVDFCIKKEIPYLTLFAFGLDNWNRPKSEISYLFFLFENFLKKNLDYLSTRTMDHSKKWKLVSEYPEGLSLEIYKTRILDKIKKYVNEKNKDYPTWNIYSGPRKFKIQGYKLMKNFFGYKFNGLRLTLDTKKDLNFIRKLIKLIKLKPGDKNFKKILIFKKKTKVKLTNFNVKSKLAYKIIFER